MTVNNQNLRWSAAEAADSAAIHAVQAIAHPVLPEAEAVLAERVALCPQGCFVLRDGEAVVGYILSHPWLRRNPPALDALLNVIPTEADVWYLHDLALLPVARGTGMASTVTPMLLDVAVAAGLRRMALVSVNGTRGFWEKQGFRAVDADLSRKLASYGDDAVYMELDA